jgi:curved DNA-binding protein CbpA
MGEQFKDYFMILEVHYLASQGTIKAAYKQLSKIHHPDLGGEKEKFQEIQEAYEILIDAASRKNYEELWLNYHSRFMNRFDTGMVASLFDLAFLPARQIVLEYMFFILHKNYEAAYEMLSDYNKRRLNKKDYIRWQSLIGEIHQLIEFDCVVEALSQNEHEAGDHNEWEKVLLFKVKVKERNLLLNRTEEEFFLRKLVYEKGLWKIRLNDIDIKKIIKKYGTIIALNHKNRKKIKNMRPIIEEHYPTQLLSIDIFVKHCEYEYSRFLRYKNPFVIMKIQIGATMNGERLDRQICELFEKHTRKIDAFSKYEKNSYLLILPETDLKNGHCVLEKLCNLLENVREDGIGDIQDKKIISSDGDKQSVKEMLESIEVYW